MLMNKEQQAKKRAATVSIISAILLTLIKIILALTTNSLAILVLSVDSFLDIAGSGTTYFSVRISGKPPDSDHRYGHGKIENLGSLIITIIILLTVGFFVYESIIRLVTNSAIISTSIIALFGIVVSISIDIILSQYLKRTATQYNSQVLEANSLQFKMDIWTQSIVIIGLIFVNFGYNNADSIIAILISGFIAYSGIKMGTKSIDVLLDRAPTNFVNRIESIVKKVDGVIKSENIRIRTSGPHTFIDMIIFVPRIFSIEKAHNIASEVEDRIKKDIPDADVLVHVEAEEGDKKVIKTIFQIASNIQGIKGIHDLWVRHLENLIEIDVHMQVNPDISLSEAHNIASIFEERLDKEFTNTTITTHIDTEVNREIHQKPVRTEVSRIKKLVKTTVANIDEVNFFGNINLKHIGNEFHVSISCTLKKDLKIIDAHMVAENIEEKIMAIDKKVRKVFVHLEPPK